MPIPPPPSSTRSLNNRQSLVGSFRWVALVVCLALACTSGCSDNGTEGLSCPLLAPGVISPADVGKSLKPFDGAAAASGTVASGRFAFHSVWVPEGTEVSATVSITNARALVMGYGARDLQGGIPGCNELRLAESDGVAAVVTFDARGEGKGGEYVVVLGLRPGDRSPDEPPLEYSVTAACTNGCEGAASVCPTLSELGCPSVRCDGELKRDSLGCPTCDCDAGALCSSGATAGPWRTCIQPGCSCPEPVAGTAVCGSNGNTYPDACHALCAGASVARTSSCEDVCPGVTQCETPCLGIRALDVDGCPTCGCAPVLPAAPSDCSCEPVDEPVCGGDGVTYRSRCEARCAGTTILYAAACVDGCTKPPENCVLDCDWGLVLSESQEVCLQCACGSPPPASCTTSGEPICATFAALATSTSVGSECLAQALGATGAVWGSCGISCASDADCTTTPPSRCILQGELQGRCVVESASQACNCSGLVQPVCGSDGADYINPCFAACSGVAVAHGGGCCQAPPTCAAAEVPVLDKFGCPTGSCGEPRPIASICRTAPPQVPGCSVGGGTEGLTVCQAHAAGVSTTRQFCAPAGGAP